MKSVFAGNGIKVCKGNTVTVKIIFPKVANYFLIVQIPIRKEQEVSLVAAKSPGVPVYLYITTD